MSNIHDVVIDGVSYQPVGAVYEHLTLADILEHYEKQGAREWDEIVTGIQKWFYNGNAPKSAWCATCISFCLAQMGLLGLSIGRRHENVYDMYVSAVGKCLEISVSEMQRGDIVFFCWDGKTKFSRTASKHVTVYNGNGGFIGGNQGGKIQVSNYDKSQIVHIMRPYYRKSSLKKLSQMPLSPR